MSRPHADRDDDHEETTMKRFAIRRPSLYLWATALAMLVAKTGPAGFHEW